MEMCASACLHTQVLHTVTFYELRYSKGDRTCLIGNEVADIGTIKLIDFFRRNIT